MILNMVLMIMMASCNKHAGFVQHRSRYKGSNCGDVSDARNWKYTEASRSRRSGLQLPEMAMAR
jgi:hypothetical protein